MKKVFCILPAISLALVACGGGSSDTGGGAGSSAAIDKFIGTWKDSCSPEALVLQASDGAETNSTRTFVLTKLSDTSANMKSIITVYAHNDTSCSGTALATIVQTGENTGSESSNASGITSSYGQNLFTHDGETTLGSGQKVEKFTFKFSKLSAISGMLTLGQIKLDSRDFAADTGKGIAYFKSATQFVWNGDDNYPTELEDVADTNFIKQ